MKPALGNVHRGFIRLVRQPVGMVDAAGSVAGKIFSQLFGLAPARKRRAGDFPDQRVDAPQHLSVAGLPVQIIFPRLFGEDYFQRPP